MEQFRAEVLHDLIAVIENLYPELGRPDAMDRAATDHDEATMPLGGTGESFAE